MKHKALILIVIVMFGFIAGLQGCFNALSFRAEKAAFAYSDNSNVQVKSVKQSGALKLMTYNIHRGIGKKGKLDLASTSDVIKSANPDIVALQEVERFSPRTGFRDEIGYLSLKLGMNYAYGKSLNILTGQYGNGLLSKYPIEEYSVIKLPSIKEQRTALRAVINISGHRLAIYNVHLGLSQAERNEQISYILQLLASEKLDYILMGDMNSTVDKLSDITKVMKDSAEGSARYTLGTIGENGLRKRIDYIFLSPEMKVTDYNIIASEASDHYPVVSEINLSKKGTISIIP